MARRTSRERAPLRAAVVGAGLMGRMHARAIAAAGGVVVAVADIDVDRAHALDQSAQPFASIDDLLGSTSPDVLHVCTPIDMHADAVARALAAGAHVIVEKPVAPDGETTRRLVEQAQAAERVVVPVHQFLFQPGVRRLVERSHELGRLVRCSFVAASAGTEKTGIAPADLVSEILPHPLSLFFRISSTGLAELEWTVVAPARGELRALTVAGDASFEIAITCDGRPTRTELELMGTRATGYADLFHGFAVIDRGRPTRTHKLARPFTLSLRTLGASTSNLARRSLRREAAYPGLQELVRSTYEAVAAGGPPPIGFDETLAVAQARDRILERLSHRA